MITEDRADGTPRNHRADEPEFVTKLRRLLWKKLRATERLAAALWAWEEAGRDKPATRKTEAALRKSSKRGIKASKRAKALATNAVAERERDNLRRLVRLYDATSVRLMKRLAGRGVK